MPAGIGLGSATSGTKGTAWHHSFAVSAGRLFHPIKDTELYPIKGRGRRAAVAFRPENRADRGAVPWDFPWDFLCGRTKHVANKPGTRPKNEFVFFDVVYEDGSQRSNRRVPAELLDGPNKDEPARGFIIEQDRDIAEKSGRLPLAIKSIRRVGVKKK
jgi:hypothetical protein